MTKAEIVLAWIISFLILYVSLMDMSYLATKTRRLRRRAFIEGVKRTLTGILARKGKA